jgi:hypothetical protein
MRERKHGEVYPGELEDLVDGLLALRELLLDARELESHLFTLIGDALGSGPDLPKLRAAMEAWHAQPERERRRILNEGPHGPSIH